jgi:hypothetical protein
MADDGVHGFNALQSVSFVSSVDQKGSPMADDYTRHTLTLLFDVPATLTADRATMDDVLNAAVSRITELIENDPRLQALLNTNGVEWGWEAGSWE